jgi:hypothetical protein
MSTASASVLRNRPAGLGQSTPSWSPWPELLQRWRPVLYRGDRRAMVGSFNGIAPSEQNVRRGNTAEDLFGMGKRDVACIQQDGASAGRGRSTRRRRPPSWRSPSTPGYCRDVPNCFRYSENLDDRCFGLLHFHGLSMRHRPTIFRLREFLHPQARWPFGAGHRAGAVSC